MRVAGVAAEYLVERGLPGQITVAVVDHREVGPRGHHLSEPAHRRTWQHPVQAGPGGDQRVGAVEFSVLGRPEYPAQIRRGAARPEPPGLDHRGGRIDRVDPIDPAGQRPGQGSLTGPEVEYVARPVRDQRD